jgi:primosomal protein N' (replication factor Y)
VRVRTEVAAVTKLLDYAVPPQWRDPVVVGTRVRLPLHGRSVRGWVVEDDVTPPAGVDVLPLKSWLGWGPPPSLVELAGWAAWRWAGPASFFLRVASPQPIVRSLPPVPPRVPNGVVPAPGTLPSALLAEAPQETPGAPVVLRIPPTTDLLDLVTAVLHHPSVAQADGSVLVLLPSVGWATRLGARLRRRGYPVANDWQQARAGWPIVLGSRAAAWAPVPELAAVVVLDAHDPAYREETAPTYGAVEVAVERARQEECLCVLASPVPTATLTEGRTVRFAAAPQERAGWAAVEVVDRRHSDPRLGLFSEEFVRLSHRVLDDPASGPLVCVYDRTGRARLLACANCGELARCTNCGAAMGQVEDRLHCPRCGAERPCVCAACGKLRMKTLRAGVSRLREELAALLGVEVAEMTGAAARAGRGYAEGDDDQLPSERVILGTKAALYRVRRAAAVVFLDLDLHLLAPRLDATEESLALLVRASRLVGPRGGGPANARLLLQTRVPEHVVVQAAVRGDPSDALADDLEVRRASGMPPFSALARLSGTQAATYADTLRAVIAGDDISIVELAPDSYLLRATTHERLCEALAQANRPSGPGLRVEVDPASF